MHSSLNGPGSKKGLLAGKLVSWVWVLSLGLLVTSIVSAQDTVSTSSSTVTTSKSTLSLPSLEGLTSENSLRQGLRIAEIGMSELTADAAALDKEEASLIKDVAAYEQTKKKEQEQRDALVARFEEANKKYLAKSAPYLTKVKEHDADAAQQRAEAAASNGLPPAKRNAGTVSRLNDWAVRVGTRKASLDQEKSLLDQELEIVESKRTAALTYEEGAMARLNATLEPLKAKIAAHKAKQGLAYRQLKQCTDYAMEIRNRLKEKFNKEEIFSPILDGAMEQLKKLSNAGFDTP